MHSTAVPIRAWIGLLVFLITAIHAQVAETWRQGGSFGFAPSDDPLSQLENRVSSFKPWLASDESVEFETDRSPDDGLRVVEQFQTQYAIAPNLLRPYKSGEEWLILWLNKPQSLDRFLEERQYEMVHDAGGGLFLLKRSR